MEELEKNLINHNEICILVYKGNQEGALDIFCEDYQELQTLSLNEIKLYLHSLNTGIYHYIFWKEKVSLHSCCEKNYHQIVSCTQSNFFDVGKEIIKTYSYCSEYLVEKLGNEHIKRAIRYIHNNLNENLTLESVSGEVNITPCYLCDLFRQTMEVTFSEYVRKERVKLAKKLLQTTSMTMSEIAYHCGFQTPTYFSACFKKVEGISPLKYKKKSYYFEEIS